MKKLFYKDKQPIGIDFGQTGIKIMAIDPEHQVIQGYGSLDLNPSDIQSALDMRDPDNTFLADSLKLLLDKYLVGELPSNHAIVGIPSARTFSRTFTIPISESSHLNDAIEAEVSQYIPLPLAALYVDYEVVERNDKTLTVGMSAVPRTVIDACLKALDTVGMRPIMIEPSAYSVARILRRAEASQFSTIIVDIGQTQTDITIFVNGAVRVSGSVSIGGNNFTVDISRALDVPIDAAHQLKVIQGLSPGPKRHKLVSALKPTLEMVVSEIRKMTRYYNERVDGETRIEQLIIVGAGSNVPGIGEYFTDTLTMPARVANPWEHINFGSLPNPSRQFRPRYVTVAGLASVTNFEVKL